MQDPYGLTFYPEFKGRDGCRTPMPWLPDCPHGGFTQAEPWLPAPAEHRAKAVNRQDSDAASVLNFSREFLRWRRGHSALRQGAIRFLDTPEPLLGFERSLGADNLLCLFNLSDAPLRHVLPARLHSLDFPGQHIHDLGGRLIDDTTVELPGRGLLFAVAA